jgi:hypothetical protein
MVASFIPSILDELDDVGITSPAAGHVLRHDGSNWVNQQLAHSDLSGIGALSHSTIDSYLDQAVKIASSPRFAGLDISAAAPSFTLTDTTPSAKSLKIDVDANIAQIMEKAGVSNSLLVLDLTNNRLGIGISPSKPFHVDGDVQIHDLVIDENPLGPGRWMVFTLNATAAGNCAIDFDPQPFSNEDAMFRFFRNTNTTNPVYFQVLKGNATATVNHVFYGKGGDSYVCADNGLFGIGTASPVLTGTGKLHMAADTMRLDTARTPASASAAGNQGEICWDSSYIYFCTAANTWRRAAHSTW